MRAARMAMTLAHSQAAPNWVLSRGSRGSSGSAAVAGVTRGRRLTGAATTGRPRPAPRPTGRPALAEDGAHDQAIAAVVRLGGHRERDEIPVRVEGSGPVQLREVQHRAAADRDRDPVMASAQFPAHGLGAARRGDTVRRCEHAHRHRGPQ